MGLDQTWLTGQSKSRDELDIIAMHRNFNALEGFMQDKWYSLGYTREFNCELLPITQEMIEELESLAKRKKLEPISGYFFGSTNKDKKYKDDIKNLFKEVLPLVKHHLEHDEFVYYSSWW